MSQFAKKRIRNEVKEIEMNPPVLWQLKENPEKWTEWIVTIIAEVFLF